MIACAEKPMTLAGSQIGHAPIRCPRWLSAGGKRYWRVIVPDLQRRGILLPVDRPLLAVLCDTLARHERAAAAIERDGLVMLNGEPHPLSEVADSTARQALKLAHNFGLTPLGRAELEAKR